MSVYKKGPITLYCGDYREVLADVEPDAVIADPPYSGRTHVGHDAGAALTGSGTPTDRRAIDYGSWRQEDVIQFVNDWSSRVGGWMVALSDSELCGPWRAAYERHGRTGFQPLPCVIRGMACRFAGDGPSSWAVYANVARPKRLRSWGTLGGAYVGAREGQDRIGGKPLWLMQALVRDYSRPGDLVCDPCAGGATTLIAAALEGRRAIGAELDPATWEKACARIERTALTPPLPFLSEPSRKPEQAGLSFDDPEAA